MKNKELDATLERIETAALVLKALVPKGSSSAKNDEVDIPEVAKNSGAKKVKKKKKGSFSFGASYNPITGKFETGLSYETEEETEIER